MEDKKAVGEERKGHEGIHMILFCTLLLQQQPEGGLITFKVLAS